MIFCSTFWRPSPRGCGSIFGEKEFEKNKLLSEITAVVGVRSEDGSGLSGSLTLFGFGGG